MNNLNVVKTSGISPAVAEAAQGALDQELIDSKKLSSDLEDARKRVEEIEGADTEALQSIFGADVTRQSNHDLIMRYTQAREELATKLDALNSNIRAMEGNHIADQEQLLREHSKRVAEINSEYQDKRRDAQYEFYQVERRLNSVDLALSGLRGACASEPEAEKKPQKGKK